jgi:hypothetical protein
MKDEIMIMVWTNGNAVRKYVGQDKRGYDKEGWYKAMAKITPVEEEIDE